MWRLFYYDKVVLNTQLCHFQTFYHPRPAAQSTQRLGDQCDNYVYPHLQGHCYCVELQTKIQEDFTITEKASTIAFSQLKAPKFTVTFKILLRHIVNKSDVNPLKWMWNWNANAKVLRDGQFSTSMLPSCGFDWMILCRMLPFASPVVLTGGISWPGTTSRRWRRSRRGREGWRPAWPASVTCHVSRMSRGPGLLRCGGGRDGRITLYSVCSRSPPLLWLIILSNNLNNAPSCSDNLCINLTWTILWCCCQ